MGPNQYGQFAALVSLLTLLVSVSGLGGLATFGRFLPQYELSGDRASARALFVQLFWIRSGVAAVFAVGLMTLMPSLLPGLSRVGFALAATALVAGSAATTCFQVFFGSKQFGKWSSQDALTRPVLLVLLAVLGGYSNLDRAVLALGLSSLGFLGLGLFWARDFLQGERARISLQSLFSQIRFGLIIFAANLMLATVWRAGETAILLLSNHPAEAAFFSIANAAVTAAGLLAIQATVMLTPSFTALRLSGDQAELEASMAYTVKYLTIAAVLTILVSYAAGAAVVERVFGVPYAAVTPNLEILVLCLPGVIVLALGLSHAIVHDRPLRAVPIGAVALAAFAIGALLLVPRWASLGASASVAIGMTGGGLVAYFTCGLAGALRMGGVGRLALCGIVSLGVIVIPSAPPLLEGVVAVVLFVLLLFAAGVVNRADVAELARGLTGRRAIRRGAQRDALDEEGRG